MINVRATFGLLLWGIASLVGGPAWGGEQLDPEAAARIQAMEKSRAETKPLRLKGKILQTIPVKDAAEHEIEVAYEDGKSRICVNGEPASTVIFDGKQLLCFNGREISFSPSGVSLTPFFLLTFNPRVIGVNEIGEMLPSRQKVSASFTAEMKQLNTMRDVATFNGIKEIDGVKVAELAIVSTSALGKIEANYWIDATNSGRVYKHSRLVVIPQAKVNQRSVVESEFWPSDSNGWLPRKTKLTVFDRGGGDQVIFERIVQFGKPLKADRLAADTWTLKGLRLPIGKSIVDLRPGTGVNCHWDGENLVREPAITSTSK